MKDASLLRRLVAVGTLAALLFGAGLVSAPPAAAVSRLERRLARLVNRFRSEHGQNRLRLSASMSRKARAHSRRMANRQLEFHTSPSQLFGVYGCQMHVGENVAHGDTVNEIHRKLKNEPAHRELMLRPYWERLGVGIARDGDGTLWATEAFCG